MREFNGKQPKVKETTTELQEEGTKRKAAKLDKDQSSVERGGNLTKISKKKWRP